MRIIAGHMKGRTLYMPRDATFRPTTDRVKESVFNVLTAYVDWSSATVCDLYAGSGNLGLEALSRGAVHVTFVEKSRTSQAALERNIDTLSAAENATVMRMPVQKFCRQAQPSFSLVFADPPYASEDVHQLLDYMASLMLPDGLAVIEHDGRRALEDSAALSRFDRRDYGTTAVTFFRFNKGASS